MTQGVTEVVGLVERTRRGVAIVEVTIRDDETVVGTGRLSEGHEPMGFAEVTRGAAGVAKRYRSLPA